MKWIAITGGLGSGKSEVSKILREFGESVLSADDYARQVVRPGQLGLQKVVKAFGPRIVTATGEIDRKKLGEIVFKDKKKLETLEEILHPLIQSAVLRDRQALQKVGNPQAFYEIPLLYEKSLAGNFDAVIVVTASEPARRKRVMERDNLTSDLVTDRFKAQLPLAEKEKLADFIIKNEGDIGQLRSEVQRCLAWARSMITTRK